MQLDRSVPGWLRITATGQVRQAARPLSAPMSANSSSWNSNRMASAELATTFSDWTVKCRNGCEPPRLNSCSDGGELMRLHQCVVGCELPRTFVVKTVVTTRCMVIMTNKFADLLKLELKYIQMCR